MTNFQLIGIVVVAAIVVAIVLIILARAQKSRRLRSRFGPEYRRAVQESGSAARGEERLAKLEQRVERFNIHPLSSSDRSRFVEAWRLVQAKFVDAPEAALQGRGSPGSRSNDCSWLPDGRFRPAGRGPFREPSVCCGTLSRGPHDRCAPCAG